MPTRAENFNRMVKLIVGQRISHDDITSALIDQGNYDRLIIPMEYDPNGPVSETALGWVDPRTETGELMCPERFPRRVVDELKLTLGRQYFAQCQQNPSTEATSLFPRHWWRYFDAWPHPDWFEQMVQSWDFVFGDEKTAQSFVAGHVWAKRGANLFLLDRVFAKLSFTDCLDAVEEMTKKWPQAVGKLVEAKANGPAVVQSLRSHVSGLVLVQVGGRDPAKGGGTKYARAEAVAWLARAGNVFLPAPAIAPWVRDFETNMSRFPAAPDDDTDAASQAWRYLSPPRPKGDPELAARVRRDSVLQSRRPVAPAWRRPIPSRTIT
jgi:predicted phage terminase large subunit-like protein